MLDAKLQLAIKAVEGLDINSLSEEGKEQAAKAIAEGYLYREGDMLYTKILVCAIDDWMNLTKLNDALIEKGLMIAPENGVGAEGCWLALKE